MRQMYPGYRTKKFRDKNTPELPNLTAYEDYLFTTSL